MSADQGKIDFGQRLRAVRGGRTQAVFAATLGIDPKTLGLYERGERWPDLGLLIRIRLLTGADLNGLATGEIPATGPIDKEVLAGIIQAVEEETPGIDPQAKAKLISRLYSNRIKVHSLGTEANPAKTQGRAS